MYLIFFKTRSFRCCTSDMFALCSLSLGVLHFLSFLVGCFATVAVTVAAATAVAIVVVVAAACFCTLAGVAQLANKELLAKCIKESLKNT